MFLTAAIAAAEQQPQANIDAQVVTHLNQRASAEGVDGSFKIERGALIFNGPFAPAWAIKDACATIGLGEAELRFGTAGIVPLQWYTKEEYHQTNLGRHFIALGYDMSWTPEGPHTGLSILACACRKIGKNFAKDILEEQKRNKEWNDKYSFVMDKMLPGAVEFFKRPKNIAISSLLILLVAGIPLAAWYICKGVYAWIATARPTILGPQDSDIYKSWVGRLLYKHPALPKVTTNTYLTGFLRKLVKRNKKITRLNKGSLRENRKPIPTPYPHLLAFGEPGVGKTLFAKKLAQRSGMHFMYLTVSDLSQLKEEDALRTLKEFFAYAKKFAPCILIIDEADKLFAKNDLKAQKMALLFQKEFSKAVDTNIQLFFLTNHPEEFPLPILNRVAEIILFDKPDFDTKKRLFEQHLSIVFARNGVKGKASDLVPFLGEELLEGLVGRDIEAICNMFVLRTNMSAEVLRATINRYKLQREAMRQFKMGGLGKGAEKAKDLAKKAWGVFGL